MEVKYFSDQETKVDMLNNEAIAKTIVQLITQDPTRPVTIGVHGDWGAGKSSILEMINASFSEDSKVLCIKFNGWQFQGFEDAKIAVIEDIIKQIVESQGLSTKIADEIKKLYNSMDKLKLAKLAFGAGLSLYGVPIIMPGLMEKKDKGENSNSEDSPFTLKEIYSLNSGKPDGKIANDIRNFQNQFNDVIDKSEIDQLVVLIDDLDRCLPETVIATLEAIRLFMFLPKTAFVIGADEAMIEYCVRNHFPNLSDTGNHRVYARNYLEKLIQVPMRIPALGKTETRVYAILTAIQSLLGDDSSEFQELLKYGRQALQKPWDRNAMNWDGIREKLGEKYEICEDYIRLIDEISPILSSGTKGNPRQIKRFLNTLNLRLTVANIRGFQRDIETGILAKLMLAERFLPSLFDNISKSVASSEDGQCKEIIHIENSLTKKTGKKSSAKKSQKSLDSKNEVFPIFGSENSENAMRWINIDPKIGSSFLKPYFFIIKDSKEYNDNLLLPEKLLELLGKLKGGNFNAADVANLLPEISSSEAYILFDELSSAILRRSDLKTRPPEMLGLIEITAAHPDILEAKYIEFLRALPTDKIGAWVASGHEKAIKGNSAKQELSTMMKIWQENTDNRLLRQTLNAITSKS